MKWKITVENEASSRVFEYDGLQEDFEYQLERLLEEIYEFESNLNAEKEEEG